jgi:hypothetical protein
MSRRKRGKRPPLKRCNRTHLVVFDTELEAKMVLASRMHRDKGEVRYFECGDHFHLTSEPRMQDDGAVDIEASRG